MRVEDNKVKKEEESPTERKKERKKDVYEINAWRRKFSSSHVVLLYIHVKQLVKTADRSKIFLFQKQE